MITEEIQRNLFDVYFAIKQVPAWLVWCKEADYNQEELDYLEKLDNEFRGYQPEKEADIWAEGVNQNGGREVYFEENVDMKISILSGRIIRGYEDALKQMKARIPFVYIKWEIDYIKKIERLRRNIRANQCHQPDQKGPNGSRVTDADIVRAREYPIEKLIEVGPGGKVLCPFHSDTRPSATIKGNFFWCYTCSTWADSIKWKMEIDKLSFVEAVKYLSR